MSVSATRPLSGQMKTLATGCRPPLARFLILIGGLLKLTYE
jgi:hypothetical protein